MLILLTLVWLIPVVIFAIWLTMTVVKKTRTTRWKLINGTLIVTLFVLILFGDEIAGRVYLDYLCKTDGGAHIYHTVKLGSEYWNDDGSPRFIYSKENKQYGNFNGLLNGKYKNSSGKAKHHFNVTEIILNIHIVETGSILAEYHKYYFGNGWVLNSVGHPFKGSSCPNTMEVYLPLINSVFVADKKIL